MKPMSLKRIAEAIGADYQGEDAMIGHISTDSRDIRPGCLFVAIKGDRFDGRDFAAKALEGGASFVVASEPVGIPPGRLLAVKDARRALLGISGQYRRSLGAKVTAVTGSVGKTTTKEMAACVCSAGFKTLKTEMNLNNEIGLSQTILKLDETHEAAVLEMGMDGPGQIAPLSVAAAPDIAVVTNIGTSHLEAMGTRENIRDEKLSITSGMRGGGVLVLNGDDNMLKGYRDSRLNIMLYSIAEEDGSPADVTASRIMEFPTHTNFDIHYGGNTYDAQAPCMGRHNVQNALAAFCVGMSLGMEPRIAVAALKKYRPAGMRQKIVVHNSFTVVEDCYNASPDSMKAALEALGNISCAGKRIAVLSDMLELGSVTEESHLEAGRLAARCGADVILCTGKLSGLYVDGAKEQGMKNALHFQSKDELFSYLREILKPEDVVWFKASRGMRLEEVIERLYREM